MHKQELLSTLNALWIQTCPCTLKETATQAVPGEGNPDADILFIGEAPGKKEDIEGRPFIGASGKFLSEMLTSIQLKREDIYITNIVKYRPPENRDPLPQEVADCAEWLQEQINIIQPKLIVTLGRYAMEHFLPGKKISEVHGQSFTQHIPGLRQQTVFVLYHPAAALYNGSLRQTLIEDFKKIPALLK